METTNLPTHGPWQPGPWHHGPWQHADGPGWWPVIPLAFGLFWLLVIGGGGYLLWRRSAKAPTSAESVLAERYARGEIDEEDYRERLAVLRA
ncbi:SHOCT domain-containing protein [Actinoallomurus spadix]|nr:SHOCT domain-containing protein [Actinoallomurus spadix]MCO5985199.1 SHOCT domain-containing protein [Actinoallomurus spadix]